MERCPACHAVLEDGVTHVCRERIEGFDRRAIAKPPCPKCHGTGQVDGTCDRCVGTGRSLTNREFVGRTLRKAEEELGRARAALNEEDALGIGVRVELAKSALAEISVRCADVTSATLPELFEGGV